MASRALSAGRAHSAHSEAAQACGNRQAGRQASISAIQFRQVQFSQGSEVGARAEVRKIRADDCEGLERSQLRHRCRHRGNCKPLDSQLLKGAQARGEGGRQLKGAAARQAQGSQRWEVADGGRQRPVCQGAWLSHSRFSCARPARERLQLVFCPSSRYVRLLSLRQSGGGGVCRTPSVRSVLMPDIGGSCTAALAS